ncbi:hypothetical protein [Streptomyces syringium]|uniref:hypothetical protein n=1 Tax=Streptomyces syringium TaxID=76729 RepID=UPI0037CEDD64
MPNTAPSAPYRVPGPLIQAIEQARCEARAAEAHPDSETRAAARRHLAHVMCTVTAAAVRDILTDYHADADAPFDAVALDLTLNRYGFVEAPGSYWTASGDRRRITDPMQLFNLTEWTDELDKDNRGGWEPLCEVTGRTSEGTHYRLDLIRAAQLPTPQTTARTTRTNSPETAFPDAQQCEEANRQAVFHPVAEDGSRPCMEVFGVMVFAYLDPGTQAVQVSIDFETAQRQLARRDGTVPLCVDVRDTVVLDTRRQDATADHR